MRQVGKYCYQGRSIHCSCYLAGHLMEHIARQACSFPFEGIEPGPGSEPALTTACYGRYAGLSFPPLYQKAVS